MSIIESQTASAVALKPAIRKSLGFLDPLDEDHPDDELVITTRRAVIRVALVAVETGGRFERERIPNDPMSWMLAPRRLFNGSAAIDACLNLEHCRRSIIVHGLGLGLDVTPAAIDALIADDDCELLVQPRVDGDEPRFLNLRRKKEKGDKNRRKNERSRKLRLYTATMSFSSKALMVNAFHASLATDVLDIIERLRERYGDDIALTADIREGFHQAMPLAIALVQAPIAEMIKHVEADPRLADPAKFAINVEQRIQP